MLLRKTTRWLRIFHAKVVETHGPFRFDSLNGEVSMRSLGGDELITEFVRNFGREDAPPYQRGSNSGLLGRIQAVKLIRHNFERHVPSPSARYPGG